MQRKDKMEDKNYYEAKSIHIFSWPFTYVKDNHDKVRKDLLSSGRWVRETEWKNSKERFMLHQYLSKKARKIFFDENSSKCEIYQYKMDDQGEYNYFIEAKIDEQIKKTFELPIDKIELHLYDFGVGILSIRVLNFKYRSIEDIKSINNLGRRTFLPFIPDEPDEGIILCAEQLGIKNRVNKTENIQNFREKIKTEKYEELIQPVTFLKSLLSGDLNEKENEQWKDLEPTADDRMFLTCLIRDKWLSEQIKQKKYSKSNIQKLLYSIIYVDSGDCECQNDKMREELFERAGYFRWSDCGTLYACTNYSLTCITDEESKESKESKESNVIKNTVVKPFVEEYFYMLSLTLAQKQGLILFSERAGEIVEEETNDSGKITPEKAEKIMKMQEDYVSFQNHFMILEISSQEQGIELYHLFQQQLLINEEQAILNQEMSGLYEVANVSASLRLTTIANKWAIIGVVIAVIALFVDLPKINLFEKVKCLINFIENIF